MRKELSNKLNEYNFDQDNLVRRLNVNTLWCEEYKDYYGNPDPKYGGKLTDLRTLPAGTKFFVANGCWEGEKLEDDYILVHAPAGNRTVKLTDEHHSLYLD